MNRLRFTILGCGSSGWSSADRRALGRVRSGKPAQCAQALFGSG